MEMTSDPELNQSSIRYLKDLTVSEKKQFLDSFDVALCDIDGVLWKIMGAPIPGVSDAINMLRKCGKKVAFVTNNSTAPVKDTLKKLEKINVNVEKDDLISPIQSVTKYLKSIDFNGLIYCIASQACKDHLRNEGFDVAEIDENEPPVLNTDQDFCKAVLKDDPVKAVFIDVDLNLKAVQLMRAQIFINRPGCLFIAGADDEITAIPGGPIIGPGQFISIIEKVSKCKAIVLGKPGMDLRDMLMKRFGLRTQKERIIFIGDSPRSDIRFGKMCGFQTLLVLSGGAKAADLNAELASTDTPDFVAESLAELNDLL